MARAVSMPRPELPPAGRQLFDLKTIRAKEACTMVELWMTEKYFKQANIVVPEAIKTEVYL